MLIEQMLREIRTNRRRMLLYQWVREEQQLPDTEKKLLQQQRPQQHHLQACPMVVVEDPLPVEEVEQEPMVVVAHIPKQKCEIDTSKRNEKYRQPLHCTLRIELGLDAVPIVDGG
jgi:hypothetical protein